VGGGIALDGYQNIYITGWTRIGSEYADYDTLLAMLSNNGILAWETTLGNTADDDIGSDIELDEEGNIYISGWSDLSWGSPIQPFRSGDRNAFVAKFGPNPGTYPPNLIWNTFLGQNLYYGEAFGISLVPGGGLYAAGESWDENPDLWTEFFVTKLDPDAGTALWYVRMGSANYVTDTIYDSAGRVTDRALGNGLTQKFVYNAWNSQGGALNVIAAGSGTWDAGTLRFANSVLDLEYSYDSVGNITQIVNTDTATESQNYGYDGLNRLTSTTVTGGPAPYSESYSYDLDTGNLASKGGVNYTYQPAHPHAVTAAGGTYTYDANGNMVTRPVNGQTYTLGYDAEGHLVTVAGGTYSAAFTYDGDGKRVKSTINSVSTIFVGNYYEKTGSTITKYYYAGATRVGMRKYTIPQSMVVEYFLGDHLGSTSITTDNAGAKVSEMRYKAFGEVRYTWKDATLTQTTPGYALTRWTFTGQYSYVDDPSTPGVEDFGLLYFNARWVDPALGRFVQADTDVPASQGVQAYDRYAFVNNNPVRYTDPSGHCIELDDGFCLREDRRTGGYHIVHPGRGRFANGVEVAIADFMLSGDTTSLNRVPASQPFFVGAAIEGACQGIGIDCGNHFQTIFWMIAGSVGAWGGAYPAAGRAPGSASSGSVPTTVRSDLGDPDCPGCGYQPIIPSQKVNQVARRGWTILDILRTRDNPALIRTNPLIVNRANGNPVTYYYRQDGNYVVIDNITGRVVQVSDTKDPAWIDEMTNLPIQPIN
jgi:RHS repeat-associated protein